MEEGTVVTVLAAATLEKGAFFLNRLWLSRIGGIGIWRIMRIWLIMGFGMRDSGLNVKSILMTNQGCEVNKRTLRIETASMEVFHTENTNISYLRVMTELAAVSLNKS